VAYEKIPAFHAAQKKKATRRAAASIATTSTVVIPKRSEGPAFYARAANSIANRTATTVQYRVAASARHKNPARSA